jgi:hypothetical protein
VYVLSGGGDDRSWATDTLDVCDADVDEVIAWAETRLGPGDLYSVALRQGDGDDPGLVWLVGFDMNDQPTNDRERAIWARMPQRRDARDQASGRPSAS